MNEKENLHPKSSLYVDSLRNPQQTLNFRAALTLLNPTPPCPNNSQAHMPIYIFANASLNSSLSKEPHPFCISITHFHQKYIIALVFYDSTASLNSPLNLDNHDPRSILPHFLIFQPTYIVTTP